MKQNSYLFPMSAAPEIPFHNYLIEKPARDYYRALDAFRGMAALVILLYHSYQHIGPAQASLFKGSWLQVLLPNLNNIVCMFFVLSGFINFLPFAQTALRQQGSFRARNFLIRRAIRIVPLYSIMVLLSVWILSYSGKLDPWPGSFKSLLSMLKLDSSHPLRTIGSVWSSLQALAGSHLFWIIGPACLLFVEFCFYLMIVFLGPLTYHLCHHLYRIKSRIITLCIAPILLFMISMACMIWITFDVHNYAVFFLFLNSLTNFSLGMFFAVIVAAFDRPLSARRYLALPLRIVAFALLGVAFYFCLPHDLNNPPYIVDQFLWELAMLLLIASTVISKQQSFWRRCLGTGPLQHLGKISYGLFLWNGPLLLGLSGYLIFTSDLSFLLSTFTLIILAICLSSVTYWLVEWPLSYLRYLFV